MNSVIFLLVLRTGYGNCLYQFLIIAYFFYFEAVRGSGQLRSLFQDMGQNKGVHIFKESECSVRLTWCQWSNKCERHATTTDGQRRLNDHTGRRLAHLRIRLRRTFQRLHVGMPVKRYLPIYLLDWFLDVQRAMITDWIRVLKTLR